MSKCTHKKCNGEVVKSSEGEFGKCVVCGEIYRFDETGYYHAVDC